MKLPRRACAAAAATAAVSSCILPPATALDFAPVAALRSSVVRAVREQESARLAAEEEAAYFTWADQELELEALATWDSPRSPLATAQVVEVGALITRLEGTRGRQQRAGWGQSDNKYDLPYIGAWEVLFASEPSAYVPSSSSGPRGGGGGAERLELVSARQWIYGPGGGGAAAECVYTLPGGPAGGSLLITRAGNVTKLEEAGLQVELGDYSRGYQLTYTVSEARELQQADGQWGTIVTTRPSSTPAVGALLSEGFQRAVCAPSAAGVLQTTYLSDTLWIVRSASSGAATVLKRTEAEALKPQMNGADGSPDGFDALKFGPSGRRLWMFDTGYDDKKEANERAYRRVRADAEVSRS